MIIWVYYNMLTAFVHIVMDILNNIKVMILTFKIIINNIFNDTIYEFYMYM